MIPIFKCITTHNEKIFKVFKNKNKIENRQQKEIGKNRGRKINIWEKILIKHQINIYSKNQLF